MTRYFGAKQGMRQLARAVLLEPHERMLSFSIMHHGARELHHHHGFQVPRDWRDWDLPEETMPQSTNHNDAINLIEAILVWWARSQPNTRVVRDLSIRWMQDHPNVGLNPDICLLRPAPPSDTNANENLRSVRTWEPGHTVPILTIEVVSETNPRKDYEVVPEKCDASGTKELCVFDPFLAGPRGKGGPHLLQLWRRDANGDFNQVYAGEGPVYSRTLNGYFIVVDEGYKLRISDDEAGLQLWPTSEEVRCESEAIERSAKEVERAAKEEAWKGEAMERSAKEVERAAKEEALAQVAELKALLAKAMNSTKK